MLDVLRVSAVVTALAIAALSLYLAVQRSRHGPALESGARWRFVGVVETMLFIAVQELTQIGHGFVWWRLPWLILINATFGTGILISAKRNWR